MPLQKNEKEQVIKDFQINPTDTGSAQVQIALLTKRIEQLTEHLKINKKDFSSKRGLLKMIAQRRTYLKYLERKDVNIYKNVITQLGLKR